MMHNDELPTMGLHGSYRDVLYDEAGRVTWDSGWKKNTIVLGCRHLIAALMKGEENTFGIQGLCVGMGDPRWDAGVPPAPSPSDIELVDKNHWKADVTIDFVDPATGQTSPDATRALKIEARLGVNEPPWPEPVSPHHHVNGTLREFGLVGMLDGKLVLLNAVRHVAIPKEPGGTLVRTIQLVF